jgi:hypothetical protein
MPPDPPPPGGIRQPRQVWPPAESHVVRTQTGRVAVAWDPWQGVFVATTPTGRSWSEPRLVDLARETRATIPAPVAKELRHAAAMNPGPRAQIRPAYQSPSPAQDRRATPANGASPPQPASAPSASGRAAPDLGPSPEWPPRDSHLVRSRAGLLAVAWNAEHACFTASTETGQTWADRRLDDLAMSAGASMPEPVVLDLLREAGRTLVTLAPPPSAASRPAAQPEWTPDPEWVTELLRRVPPKESQRLKPVLANPDPAEPGGAERVETARVAARAIWGVWVQEAPDRLQLMERLHSVSEVLSKGGSIDQVVQDLEALVERFGSSQAAGSDAATAEAGDHVSARDAAIARLSALSATADCEVPAVGAS